MEVLTDETEQQLLGSVEIDLQAPYLHYELQKAEGVHLEADIVLPPEQYNGSSHGQGKQYALDGEERRGRRGGVEGGGGGGWKVPAPITALSRSLPQPFPPSSPLPRPPSRVSTPFTAPVLPYSLSSSLPPPSCSPQVVSRLALSRSAPSRVTCSSAKRRWTKTATATSTGQWFGPILGPLYSECKL